MFNLVFKENLYELVCKCVKKDENTFISDAEKDFFLCLLEHFFTINNCNNFYSTEIDWETYHKFYMEAVRLHYPFLNVENIEYTLLEGENGDEEDE